jgi:hypothetical protein
LTRDLYNLVDLLEHEGEVGDFIDVVEREQLKSVSLERTGGEQDGSWKRSETSNGANSDDGSGEFVIASTVRHICTHSKVAAGQSTTAATDDATLLRSSGYNVIPNVISDGHGGELIVLHPVRSGLGW